MKYKEIKDDKNLLSTEIRNSYVFSNLKKILSLDSITDITKYCNGSNF